MTQMTYKIGVYGSNRSEGPAAEAVGRALGKALAESGALVITGACSGTPYVVAHEAARCQAEVWGFTPELTLDAHARAYPQDDSAIYTRLVYVPGDYRERFLTAPATAALDLAGRLKYRNVISTINADAGIIIAGGWGTLNEFTNLLYDGKPIGVLTGTGGLADVLPAWYPHLPPKSSETVVFEADPRTLVARLLAELERRQR